jgi:isoleucyl-tRNA synthetase
VYVRARRREFVAHDQNAFQALYTALLTYVRLLAPVMPFMAEYLYQYLRQEDMPESVHLTEWPTFRANFVTHSVLAEMKLVQSVLREGRALRARSGYPLRQPLQELNVYVDEPSLESWQDLLKKELSVKRVNLRKRSEVPSAPKLNFKKLGPKYGQELPKLQKEFNGKNYELKGDCLLVGEFVLESSEFELVCQRRDNFELTQQSEFVLELNLKLTEELRREGLLRDWLHQMQNLRKTMGLDFGEEVEVKVSASGGLLDVLRAHKNYLSKELCARSVSFENVKEHKNTVQGHNYRVELVRLK